MIRRGLIIRLFPVSYYGRHEASSYAHKLREILHHSSRGRSRHTASITLGKVKGNLVLGIMQLQHAAELVKLPPERAFVVETQVHRKQV